MAEASGYLGVSGPPTRVLAQFRTERRNGDHFLYRHLQQQQQPMAKPAKHSAIPNAKSHHTKSHGNEVSTTTRLLIIRQRIPHFGDGVHITLFSHISSL